MIRAWSPTSRRAAEEEVPVEASGNLRIDTHNHGVPESAIELLGGDRSYAVEVKGRTLQGKGFSIAVNASFTDADAKLADLERCDLEAAVVSLAPLIFGYECEAEAGEALSEAINAGLFQICATSGGRLRWMASSPLQAPERAAAVLKHAADSGCVGVDTITHDPQALSYLIQRMGAENVVMGTDIPFDMAKPEPMRELEAVIDADTVRQVAELNPARMFGFPT